MRLWPKCPGYLKMRWTFGHRNGIPWWARMLWPSLHFCIEWDGLVIERRDPEFKYCRCFSRPPA